MERSFAGLEEVGVALLEGEERAAILDPETEFGHDVARAETGVVALDERDHLAGGVGHHQEGRVTVIEAGVAGLDALRGACSCR